MTEVPYSWNMAEWLENNMEPAVMFRDAHILKRLQTYHKIHNSWIFNELLPCFQVSRCIHQLQFVMVRSD